MSDSTVPRVFGIIPAAGASKRLGRPKQLLPVGESTLLNTVIDAVLAGGLDDLVVVTNGAVSEALGLTKDRRFRTAILGDPETEMLECVLLGMETLSKLHGLAEKGSGPFFQVTRCQNEPRGEKKGPDPFSGFMVCPGDIAGVSSQLVARCAAEYKAHPGTIVVAAIGSKPGHPIVFPAGLREDLERFRGVGLKRVLTAHPGLVRRVQVDDPRLMTDIDTPEDYEAHKRSLPRG